MIYAYKREDYKILLEEIKLDKNNTSSKKEKFQNEEIKKDTSFDNIDKSDYFYFFIFFFNFIRFLLGKKFLLHFHLSIST